jgi:hypothetical protein
MLQLGLLAQAAYQAAGQPVADAAARVGVGRIVGGWEYVNASYAIAYASMAGYALYLWARGRRLAASSDTGGDGAPRLPPPTP